MKNCFRLKKERVMTTTCNTQFWTGSFCYKGHHWDNCQNLNGVRFDGIVYQRKFPGF